MGAYLKITITWRTGLIEIIIALSGLLGGFLIAIGWYRRGILEMEKELGYLKSRMSEMESESHGTRTDLEVIKQRIGYMESKIDDMHRIIMRPVKIIHEE